ncbi:Putative Fe-S cluster assembly protein IscX [Candidatus Trichorickettsia mobilis]|jgi:FeS assembly protein IscX|uniref:Fe-S cluster assembly protein IscX n=1 Tax=Candidatus Trichorickettsia mobilis TaxID=1346319 RepID=A0ABZ0UYS5_9RICK|nr:Fe-S cluster assembly protein IscX [Candidatus Trichorickettsia mobilis]WPY01229.1 Putative Fe-S cluster assembly protein IscX [Candidatus Trichorickettsia mobilis]
MLIDNEEIAEFLEDNYPEEDISPIKLSYLEEMIRSLSELEDEEIQLSKEILQEIKETWLALRERS